MTDYLPVPGHSPSEDPGKHQEDPGPLKQITLPGKQVSSRGDYREHSGGNPEKRPLAGENSQRKQDQENRGHQGPEGKKQLYQDPG